MNETKRPAAAADAYRQRRHAVAALLEELRGKLDAHAQRAAAGPANWGYAGDLGHVEEVLRDLAAFMR
jgi:hypothetical protein